ncbi:MAG TPA: hypothetical protein DCQ31_08505 [Bacteroidales bacterium]|nr:hypothetical protein [Bacteroidales bacterium]
MNRNPKHLLCDSAKIYIENLNERRTWERAALLNTGKSYAEYLSKYPSGQFSDSAEIRKSTIATERAKLNSTAEKNEWTTAKQQHTVIAYSDFLMKYPAGTYAEAAKLLIAELEREAKEGLKVVSNVTAEDVVKGFIIDIGKRNYYSAYMRTRNSYWADYESFSSTDLYGSISNTTINTIRTASETENTATVWTDYVATEAETGDLGFKQSFQLNKINGEWKITSVKLEEKYTLGVPQE